MLKGTRTALTMQLDLLLASHFLNKACECHCPATVFSAFTQGCWSFPLIAHHAVLKGTRTAHTMQLDLLLASHFLNKACECHCPATVFFAFTQGCWSFPLIAHYAMLKGTRTALTMQLDLLLASHFLNKACECHCPATAFSDLFCLDTRLLIFPYIHGSWTTNHRDELPSSRQERESLHPSPLNCSGGTG